MCGEASLGPVNPQGSPQPPMAVALPGRTSLLWPWGLPGQNPHFETTCGVCLTDRSRPAGLRAGAPSRLDPPVASQQHQGTSPPPLKFSKPLIQALLSSAAKTRFSDVLSFAGMGTLVRDGLILSQVPYAGCLPAIPYGPGLLVETFSTCHFSGV